MFTKRIETVKKYDSKTKGYIYPQKAQKADTGQLQHNLIQLGKLGAMISFAPVVMKIGLPLAAVTIPLAFAGKVFASDGGGVVLGEAVTASISADAKAKIIHAFDPLMDLMVALSLPLAGVILTGGCLMMLVGLKEPGLKLIINSSLGYVLVQMSPLFLDLLAGVGGAI